MVWIKVSRSIGNIKPKTQNGMFFIVSGIYQLANEIYEFILNIFNPHFKNKISLFSNPYLSNDRSFLTLLKIIAHLKRYILYNRTYG
jgi:hypothetical protein